LPIVANLESFHVAVQAQMLEVDIPEGILAHLYVLVTEILFLLFHF